VDCLVGFRRTRWLRSLAAYERPHRSAASVRLSQAILPAARWHRRSAVQRQGAADALGRRGSGRRQGRRLNDRRPGLSPRPGGASELMQTGSEAITGPADRMTSKSDESQPSILLAYLGVSERPGDAKAAWPLTPAEIKRQPQRPALLLEAQAASARVACGGCWRNSSKRTGSARGGRIQGWIEGVVAYA